MRSLFASMAAVVRWMKAYLIKARPGRTWLWTTAKYFAAFALLAAIEGFLGAASGIIPITASSGHWAATRWFLQFSKQRSVSTHSIGIEVSALDDPRLILRGAGAYETNCSACHGSPSVPRPGVAQHLTPRPPYLPTTLHNWGDAELHYIVKHGIKFTGMPAWPAQRRDDEVWAIVAFIRRLPDLDPKGYQLLANGDPVNNSEVSLKGLLGPAGLQPPLTESCVRCHGADGLGRGSAFPKLAGQNPAYIFNTLQAYANNMRRSGVMGPVSVGLNADEMLELAQYYAALEVDTPVVDPSDSGAIERGRRIALDGIPQQRVASCVSCHGPSSGSLNPAYPSLAGQYSDYLSLQLELFKNGARGGTDYAHIMRLTAERLSAQQVRDVTLYYSSLSPADRPR